jgi:hypothetical protein
MKASQLKCSRAHVKPVLTGYVPEKHWCCCKAGANAGYSEGDSAQQEARAGLEAGESDPAGATATARR